MQHSASATASPPCEQSWAERRRPRRIASRQTRWTRTSRSRSICGRPATRPWISRRYSLPASVCAGDVQRRRPAGRPRRPARWKPIAQRRSTSSSSPSMPTTGVGQDGLAVRLVVEADVAGDDRRAELLAGRRHAADRLLHLVVDVELLRIAEVEAVGDGERLRAGADDVARRLSDGDGAAGVGVEVAVEAVAVGGEGDARFVPLTRRTAASLARPDDGVGEHLVVVLAPHPALVGKLRRRPGDEADAVAGVRPPNRPCQVRQAQRRGRTPAAASR